MLGGQGVNDVTLVEKDQNFGTTMKQQNLCDLVITGEGEQIIKEILAGKTSGPGINNNNPVQVDNLDALPYPNYSFYDLDRYDYLSKNKEVFIVGSRGCVRRCTYCDVARYGNFGIGREKILRDDTLRTTRISVHSRQFDPTVA